MPATIRPNRRTQAQLRYVARFRRWLISQRIKDFKSEYALELAMELARELKRVLEVKHG